MWRTNWPIDRGRYIEMLFHLKVIISWDNASEIGHYICRCMTTKRTVYQKFNLQFIYSKRHFDDAIIIHKVAKSCWARVLFIWWQPTCPAKNLINSNRKTWLTLALGGHRNVCYAIHAVWLFGVHLPVIWVIRREPCIQASHWLSLDFVSFPSLICLIYSHIGNKNDTSWLKSCKVCHTL